MYFRSFVLCVLFGAALAEEVNQSCPKIITRESWNAQPPVHQLSNLTNPVPLVIIIHTATNDCSSESSCALRVRLIQTLHIESFGWDDIGYSFLIGGDGNIYEGRGWSKSGAHTFGYNSRSVGIAFIGTFQNKEPSESMMAAARSLMSCGKAGSFLSTDFKVLGHRQVSSTISPGDKLYALIKEWPEWLPQPITI